MLAIGKLLKIRRTEARDILCWIGEPVFCGRYGKCRGRIGDTDIASHRYCLSRTMASAVNCGHSSDRAVGQLPHNASHDRCKVDSVLGFVANSTTSLKSEPEQKTCGSVELMTSARTSSCTGQCNNLENSPQSLRRSALRFSVLGKAQPHDFSKSSQRKCVVAHKYPDLRDDLIERTLSRKRLAIPLA